MFSPGDRVNINHSDGTRLRNWEVRGYASGLLHVGRDTEDAVYNLRSPAILSVSLLPPRSTT